MWGNAANARGEDDDEAEDTDEIISVLSGK